MASITSRLFKQSTLMLTLSTCFTLVTSPLSAWGQTTQAESRRDARRDAASQAPPEVAVVEVVVTGTRSAESIERSTLHTGLVTRQDAERRGAMSVAEALEGEPGLQVNPSAYDHLGSPAGVMMQGLDAERVLILRDGERVVGDSGGVVDLEQFSIADVERVEYVLGPSSSLYGTGALGGVVNIITGGPQSEGLSGRTRLELRSLPELMTAGSVGYRAGEYWAGSSASYRQAAGVPASRGESGLARAATKRLELGVRLGADADRVSSVAEISWARNRSDGLQSQQFPGLGTFLVDLPDSSQRVKARVRQTYELSQSMQLRASASGQLFTGESNKDRRDSPVDERRFRQQRLLSAELVTTLDEGSRTWIAGARAEQEDFEQSLTAAEVSGGSVLREMRPEVEATTLGSAAAFAQLAWRFGERVTVLPGVRVERHRRFGWVTAPRLAAAWRPTSRWQARASIGRGFRAPSAKEYGFVFDHSFLGYRVIGNRDLRPERSWGVNADLSFAASPRVKLRVSGFHNWVSSLIDTDFVGQSTLGVDDFSYVNVGRARTLGGDVSASFRVGARLRTQVAYSYLFARNDVADTPLQSRPAHTVSSSLNYLLGAGFEVSARSRMVSSAYLADDLESPGFVKLDVRLARRLFDSMQLYVGVLNALDSKDDPRRPGDQRPVAGRLWYVGITTNTEDGI